MSPFSSMLLSCISIVTAKILFCIILLYLVSIFPHCRFETNFGSLSLNSQIMEHWSSAWLNLKTPLDWGTRSSMLHSLSSAKSVSYANFQKNLVCKCCMAQLWIIVYWVLDSEFCALVYGPLQIWIQLWQKLDTWHSSSVVVAVWDLSPGKISPQEALLSESQMNSFILCMWHVTVKPSLELLCMRLI